MKASAGGPPLLFLALPLVLGYSILTQGIFDLGAALELGLFARDARDAAEAASSGSLNELFSLGAAPRQALRARLSEILDANGSERSRLEVSSTTTTTSTRKT